MDTMGKKLGFGLLGQVCLGPTGFRRLFKGETGETEEKGLEASSEGRKVATLSPKPETLNPKPKP